MVKYNVNLFFNSKKLKIYQNINMSDLTKLSTKILKEKLKALKLPVSGKKSVLIERLLSGPVIGKQKASRKTTRKASRKTTRKVSRKTTRKASRKTTRKASRKKSRKVGRKKSRKVSRKKSRKVSRKKTRKKTSINPIRKRKVSRKVKRNSRRYASTKSSRVLSWKNKTRAEIASQLKGMSLKEIRGSPYFKKMKYLEGKSGTKRIPLVKHLENLILTEDATEEEDISNDTKPSTKPSTNNTGPVPQHTIIDIEKEIRKCLYGERGVVPTKGGKKKKDKKKKKDVTPIIVDSDDSAGEYDDDDEELDIVDEEY